MRAPSPNDAQQIFESLERDGHFLEVQTSWSGTLVAAQVQPNQSFVRENGFWGVGTTMFRHRDSLVAQHMARKECGSRKIGRFVEVSVTEAKILDLTSAKNLLFLSKYHNLLNILRRDGPEATGQHFAMQLKSHPEFGGIGVVREEAQRSLLPSQSVGRGERFTVLGSLDGFRVSVVN